MKNIAPSFSKELADAGLSGLPFAWSDDGTITFDDAMPESQRLAVLAVYEAHNPQSPAPDVPQVVTMRQARLALLGAGLLQQVDQAINVLPEPQQSAARIEWDYSSEVHRDRDFVQQLGQALGLSDEQLDALFIQAAAL